MVDRIGLNNTNASNGKGLFCFGYCTTTAMTNTPATAATTTTTTMDAAIDHDLVWQLATTRQFGIMVASLIGRQRRWQRKVNCTSTVQVYNGTGMPPLPSSNFGMLPMCASTCAVVCLHPRWPTVFPLAHLPTRCINVFSIKLD